jgi:DNA-binding winged helix-turn-helix (wHTH) protein
MELRAMKNPAPALPVVRFGVFEFDPQSGDLRKHGLKIKLQPQAFKLLSLLLERPGEIRTRAEIQQRLWAANTFRDFERCLNKSVHVLREALGDTAINPRYIETAIGVGYRFISISQEPRRPAPGQRNRGRIDCLAVLPLSSEPAGPELEFLARRIVERLIDNISRFSGTRVLAYRTVQHYCDADLDPRALGERLFVRAVVAGEIVQRNDELLLHLELIGVDDGTQLLGTQFRGLSSDVLASPEKIADGIFRALQTILAPSTCRKRYARTNAA